MKATSLTLLRVLIIDDNEADRVVYQRLLNRSTDYEFVFAEAECAADALEEMQASTPDCVLLDYYLPDCDGLEVVANPEFAKYQVPVVMLTGLGTVAVAKDAMKAGVHDCLSKRNATTDGLLTAIVDAIAAGELARSIEADTAEWRWRANHDPLTRLPNRESLWESLAKYLEESAGQGSGSVAMVDLDGFKPINDHHGHSAGDAVLREVGKRLKAVSPEGAIAARVGGDEFVVFCAGATSEQGASDFAQRIVDALLPRISANDIDVSVGASVGLVYFNAQRATADELVEAADLAMYRAKRPGRSSTVVHQFGDEPVEDKQQCVLLVDDETDFRRPLARQLRKRGFEVVEAVNFHDARKRLEVARHAFSFLLTDVHLGDGLGIDLARAVNGQSRRIPVLMMSGNGSIEYAVEALRLGVVDFLAKPFNDSDLDRALARVERAQSGTR